MKRSYRKRSKCCSKKQKPLFVLDSEELSDVLHNDKIRNICSSENNSTDGWEDMFVCEEKKKIFKTDGISEEERVESDSYLYQKRERWSVSCVIQLRLLPLIPNPSHGSMQVRGRHTVGEVGNKRNIT